MSWRVGRKVGRTVYDGDTLIGVMDTPELAAKVVAAVNATRPLIVEIGIGHGCWTHVKDPLLHTNDNSISFLGKNGQRYRTVPGNWRSTGPVPEAGPDVFSNCIHPRV